MGAKVQVIFAGDTRQLDGAWRQVRGEADKTESRFSKFKKFAGPAMFAGAAIGVAVFKDALTGLRAEAEATRTLEQTLKTMGRTQISTDEIVKFASTLQANSNFVEEDILSAAGVMATFGNIADKDLGRANQAAADLAARFGMDLSGATTMLGKALNDPVAGLTALSRAGVQFTDDQKGMIARMVEAGDVAGAQRLIFEELEKQTKGAAAAQQDAFGKLGDVVGETAETVLSSLMPALEGAANGLSSFIGWLEKLPGGSKLVVGAITGIIGVLWLLHAHPIVAALSAIVGVLVYLETEFGAVSAAASFLAGAFLAMAGVAVGALQGLLDHVLGVAAGVLRAFAWMADAAGMDGHAENLRRAAGNVDNFKMAANTALGAIRTDIQLQVDARGAVAQIDGFKGHLAGVPRHISVRMVAEWAETDRPRYVDHFVQRNARRRFHSGGITPGPPTDEIPALLRGGERILPSATMGGHGGGGLTLQFYGPVVGGEAGMRDLARTIEDIVGGRSSRRGA